MTEVIPQFTPVNLITGFLGSGKTTLLARLLADPALSDTAVLINEFGEVGLDHHLLGRIDERTVLLQSGCLCCTIRGELADAIRDLHSRRARGAVPPFRRLAIESTGLADPFPILSTVHADPVLKHHFRLGRVIATVDAVNARSQLTRHAQTTRQIAAADCVVVTKTDLASAATTADVVQRLAELNPAAVVLQAANGTLNAERLLSGTAFDTLAHRAAVDDAALHRHGNDAPRHGDDIEAFALSFDRKLDWTVFGIWLTMLLNRHGEAVLRVKGILDVAGCDVPVAVHGVQHLVHPPTHMAAWPDGARGSRLVFIVKGLRRADIETSLAAFGAFRTLAPV